MVCVIRIFFVSILVVLLSLEVAAQCDIVVKLFDLNDNEIKNDSFLISYPKNGLKFKSGDTLLINCEHIKDEMDIYIGSFFDDNGYTDSFILGIKKCKYKEIHVYMISYEDIKEGKLKYNKKGVFKERGKAILKKNNKESYIYTTWFKPVF